MKKLSYILLSILCFAAMVGNVNAESISEKDILETFKNKIESSEYYKENKSEIKGLFTEIVNEDGMITVAYGIDETENPKKTLVFVGNEMLEFEQVLMVDINDQASEVADLLHNMKTKAHLGNCVEDKCTKTSYIQYNPQPGCSSIVGQPCKALTAIPGYGYYLMFLCRGSVFIGCNFDINKRCTQWSHYEYECTIP